MKLVKNILFLCGLILTSLPAMAQGKISDDIDLNRDAQKILFLGSSYFGGNNLPSLFKSLVDSSGKDVFIDQYIPGGPA